LPAQRGFAPQRTSPSVGACGAAVLLFIKLGTSRHVANLLYGQSLPAVSGRPSTSLAALRYISLVSSIVMHQAYCLRR
jgi:hypothetical protein